MAFHHRDSFITWEWDLRSYARRLVILLVGLGIRKSATDYHQIAPRAGIPGYPPSPLREVEQPPEGSANKPSFEPHLRKYQSRDISEHRHHSSDRTHVNDYLATLDFPRYRVTKNSTQLMNDEELARHIT